MFGLKSFFILFLVCFLGQISGSVGFKRPVNETKPKVPDNISSLVSCDLIATKGIKKCKEICCSEQEYKSCIGILNKAMQKQSCPRVSSNEKLGSIETKLAGYSSDSYYGTKYRGKNCRKKGVRRSYEPYGYVSGIEREGEYGNGYRNGIGNGNGRRSRRQRGNGNRNGNGNGYRNGNGNSNGNGNGNGFRNGNGNGNGNGFSNGNGNGNGNRYRNCSGYRNRYRNGGNGENGYRKCNGNGRS